MTENTQAAEATNTDIATLPPAERAMIVLGSSKTEVQLREMVEETKAITEIKDATGRDQAHRAGMKLKTARTTIEKTGKTARDDANAFSKAIIGEEKRLIAIVEAEEKRVLALRDTYDAALAAEKAAQEAADQARKDEIRGKIDGIRRLPLDLAGETAEGIAAELNALGAFEPAEEVFQEFTADCATARHEVMGALRELYDRVRAQEDAAALVQAEREHLAQVKREADAQLAAEREALAAERAALEAERREKSERVEAERLAIAQERAALAAEWEAMKAQKPVFSAELIGTEIAPVGSVAVHPNGAPMYSATVFKDNGEPIMLDDQGKRSIFCDIADDMDPPADRSHGIFSHLADDDTAPAAESGIVMFDDATPTGEVRNIGVNTGDFIDENGQEFGVFVGRLPAITGSKVRNAALATAEQFDALADKVQACGVPDFAHQLRAVAYGLREGDHDAKIAAADVALLIEADNRLLDATVRAVDGLAEQEVAA